MSWESLRHKRMAEPGAAQEYEATRLAYELGLAVRQRSEANGWSQRRAGSRSGDDGYGIAHPRRFGLACHIGVLTGLPSFGVAKTPFTTGYTDPGPERGDWSELREGDDILGRVLRTRYQTKPVFVSIGHRISLDEAT